VKDLEDSISEEVVDDADDVRDELGTSAEDEWRQRLSILFQHH
jgi:hypothetical protein